MINQIHRSTLNEEVERGKRKLERRERESRGNGEGEGEGKNLKARESEKLCRLQNATQGSASGLKNAVATWLLSPVWSAEYNPC